MYFWLNGEARTMNRFAYDKNNNFIGNLGPISNYIPSNITKFDTSKISYLILVAGVTTDLSNLVVNYSSTDSEYIEHQEQLLPIDIPFNMYSGKPYKENGKWYRPIEFFKERITGSNVELKGSHNGIYQYKINLSLNTKRTDAHNNIFSNYFSNVYNTAWYNNDGVIGFDSTNITYLVVTTSKYKTISEFLEFINTNNAYVVYQLAEPYAEEITDTTLIAQLEELQKAHSYYEVTNINSYGSEDAAPLVLSGEYIRSNKVRLENLEKAILSLGGNV